jgi:dienelactone hydrolase
MRTRLIIGILALLLMFLAGMMMLAYAQDAEPEDDTTPAPAASARKPHAPLAVNNDTIGELRMQQVGSIILPDARPPYPGVVVLHGCNGVSQNTRVWARRLAGWGYAALIVDSFSTRGPTQVCDGSRALPGPERAKDAFAAAAYLRSRSDIDPKRIAVLGYSHGGWTALNTSTQKRVEQEGVPPFNAIVALYPFCPPKFAPPLATDVLILSGEADDWAKASNCQAFVEKYGGEAPHRPYLQVYARAHHSFNAMRPEREYFGHKLIYDPKATADAVERTRKFLEDRLRPE